VRRLGRHTFEIDVADKPAVLEPVDADIDDDRARSHHLRQDEIGISRGHHQHVGKQRNCAKSRVLA